MLFDALTNVKAVNAVTFLLKIVVSCGEKSAAQEEIILITFQSPDKDRQNSNIG